MSSLFDLLYGLLEPWLLLSLAAGYLPKTIVGIVKRGAWATFGNWSAFSSEWFAVVWTVGGPMVRAGAESKVVPLLQGRVRAGAVVPVDVATQCGVGGTVIEIGPGSGMWVSIFSDKYVTGGPEVKDGKPVFKKGERSRVDKVYGIEPNPGQHPALRARAKDAGLEGRYEIVPVGIEDIAGRHIAKESVDAIVTVLCLCSIPDQEKNVAELYQYLKPGGRWFVYEHVKSHPSQGEAISLYQRESTVWWQAAKHTD